MTVHHSTSFIQDKHGVSISLRRLTYLTSWSDFVSLFQTWRGISRNLTQSTESGILILVRKTN